MAKKLTLEAAVKYLEREFGDGIVQALDKGGPAIVSAISTGSFLVDWATGVGGLPRGRIIELFGPEGSGKSSVLLHTAACCQAGGEAVLWEDYEHAFDRGYAASLGVDLSPERFLLTQPQTMEDGLEICKVMVENGLVGLVVFDSLAAMPTKVEFEAEIGDRKVASGAQVMAQALKQLTGVVASSRTAVAFINQVRDEINTDPFTRRMGIRKETTPGGRALKFYAAMRIRVEKLAAVKGRVRNPVSGKLEDGPVAIKSKVEVVKNKVAPPYRRVNIILRFGGGVDNYLSALDVAVARGWIEKSGSKYTVPPQYGGGQERAFNGAAQVLRFYYETPEAWQLLEAAVKEAVGKTVSEYRRDIPPDEMEEVELGDEGDGAE